MSKEIRSLVALAVSLVFASIVSAQAPPQPGPEHQKLKELEGTWDAVIKTSEGESKGTMVWKMDLGGMWIASEFQGEFGDQKFSGKGFDSFDAVKKKYVSVWVDSMSTLPVVTEGTFDKDGKVQTMSGEGPGPDGKPAKYKLVTEHKDKNTLLWTMYSPGPDGKDVAMLSISYQRRK